MAEPAHLGRPTWCRIPAVEIQHVAGASYAHVTIAASPTERE